MVGNHRVGASSGVGVADGGTDNHMARHTTMTAATTAATIGFVTRQGGQLYLGAAQFRFSGTNQYSAHGSFASTIPSR